MSGVKMDVIVSLEHIKGDFMVNRFFKIFDIR